jgi:hypothetical protein
MEKMGIRSVAQLVQVCEAAGLLSNQSSPGEPPEGNSDSAKHSAAPI